MPQELKLLIDLYPVKSNKELVEMFGRSPGSIQHKATRLGLRKTKETIFETWSQARNGEKSASWKGGRKKTSKGHVLLLKKGHPMADANGYVLEHRYIMSEHLGRMLSAEEVVHHKNGIKDDNRIENLEIMTRGKHVAVHNFGKRASLETRRKISEKTKERFLNEENHPSYKAIDIAECLEERNAGKTVKQICEEKGITRKTFYNKLNKEKEKQK